ncbi:MAG: hypothetical protein QOG21_2486, partial [Actinomycetota bacterium]|nr:hypothetical protein [Actinomycetota bacterium]
SMFVLVEQASIATQASRTKLRRSIITL